MKTFLGGLVLSTLAATLVAPAAARDAAQQEAQQTYALRDGSTLFVFNDGRMAKEDRYGRAVNLTRGEVLESVDGKRIEATGNEVARLDVLLRRNHD